MGPLVSYNVNSFNFSGPLCQCGLNYRKYFVWGEGGNEGINERMNYMTRFLALCLLLSAVGCSSFKPAGNNHGTPPELQFTVEAAPEWTQLFYRQSGWFGADDFLLLDGGRTVPQ